MCFFGPCLFSTTLPRQNTLPHAYIRCLLKSWIHFWIVRTVVPWISLMQEKGVELHQFGWQLRSIIPELLVVRFCKATGYVGLKVLLDFGLLVRAVISPFISIMIFDDVYICLIFCYNFHAGLILYPPPTKKEEVSLSVWISWEPFRAKLMRPRWLYKSDFTNLNQFFTSPWVNQIRQVN